MNSEYVTISNPATITRLMGDADLCPANPPQDFESLFAETELLKKSCVIQSIADVNIGSTKWEVRQELQDKYRALLLTNLEMSIKNGIEMDLWRYTCYNFISRMHQHMTQYKSIAGLHKIFLHASTGFFSQLLQELCETYRKKIKAMPSARYLGVIQEKVDHRMVEEHFKYICHFCLVKLGDIARYNNDSNGAKAFYHQALQVKPLNGQPYNQLACLSATHNKDDIETLYLHVRSIAASFPFPAGQANLDNWLLKCVSDVKTSDKLYANFNFLVFRVLYEREPMTLNELCRDFLEEAKNRMKLANRPFGDLFVKLSAILIYLHKQSLSKGEEYQTPVYGLIVEFMSVLASEAEESGRLDSTREILPTLVILAHWFQNNYTREKDDLVPASLWADLNSFVKKQADLPDDKNVAKATLEEEELRAFEPLQDVLKVLGACDKGVNLDVIRVMRLRNLLHWASINKMTAFEQEAILNHKSLSFGEEKVNNTQYNSVPISPMFVPYPMMPSAPLPYPMNAPEQHRAPFPVNPDPPFMPPPEPQRPSFLQAQYPSVMYHDMGMSLPGVHDTRKTEQRDFSPQNFMPPPPPHGQVQGVQSFIHSNKFMPNNNVNSKFLQQVSIEDKLQSLRANGPPLMPHIPPQSAHVQPQVDQRSMYRPSPMFTGPFMQRPNNGATNSQFPVNNNMQFPPNNNSQFPINSVLSMMNNTNHVPMSLQNGMSKQLSKEDDFANAFVSSSVSSPFSLGTTPWAPITSDPSRRELQDIWSLTGEQEEHEITSLQQLLNGKK